MSFIKTSDKETATKLEQQGLVVISYENGIYTFVNNGKLNFSDDIINNVVFTNMLTV